MNSDEEQNAAAAKTMARLTTSAPAPQFHGWLSVKGGWVGWYDGGQAVWLKRDNFGFGTPP